MERLTDGVVGDEWSRWIRFVTLDSVEVPQIPACEPSCPPGLDIHPEGSVLPIWRFQPRNSTIKSTWAALSEVGGRIFTITPRIQL